MEKEEQFDKNQFIIIPEFLFEYPNLLFGEKILFADIISLSSKVGFCWGTNQYFSNRYGVGSKTISRWIRRLKELNLIKVEMIYDESSLEVKQRRITVNQDFPKIKEFLEWYGHRCLYPMDMDVSTPMDTDVQENNKYINNKYLLYLKDSKIDSETVLFSEDEYEKLKEEFGELQVNSELEKYKKWKREKKAHPKSDFDSFKKWLIKTSSKTFAKKQTAVQETGCDEVSDKELENLPF